MSLRRLVVDDFRLIAHAEVEFDSGMTALTGESGSGKTMMLEALDVALGGRAAADAVRTGAKRARVALEVDATATLCEVLARVGVEAQEDDSIVIVREIAEGRSSARINGALVSAAQVRALGAVAAEIVGQHESQRLLIPAEQLEALDRYGGATLLEKRAQYSDVFCAWNGARESRKRFEQSEQSAADEAAFAEFAVTEITTAHLEVGEDARARERQAVLQNSERIAASLRAALDALDGKDDGEGALDAIGASVTALGALTKYGPAFESLNASASALQSDASEVQALIARELEQANAEPDELEALLDRVNFVERLKKKYGGSIESVLAAAERYQDTIERVRNSESIRAQLDRDVVGARSALEAAARELTTLRINAARRCEQAISAELEALAMGASRLAIAIEPLGEIGDQGAERVEFRFAATGNEPQRTIARTASGGELSRVMLALTLVLLDRAASPTLVFDEIDTGVGGTTANAVAQRLATLARSAQVVCVTHLAQIAAVADRQIALRRVDAIGATRVELHDLRGDERLTEISRMLSGNDSGVSLEHARDLLARATVH